MHKLSTKPLKSVASGFPALSERYEYLWLMYISIPPPPTLDDNRSHNSETESRFTDTGVNGLIKLVNN